MAATIATATGTDTGRVKQTHRRGSQTALGEAATWRTFAAAYVNRNGSGYISVRQNGVLLARVTFGPESQPPAAQIEQNGIEMIAIRKHWGDGYQAPKVAGVTIGDEVAS